MDNSPELAAIGGGAQSDLFLKLIATAIDKPIVRSEGAEAGPAYGAARLAACGDGALAQVDLAFQPPATVRFEPAEERTFFERLTQFRRLYADIKNVN